MNSQQRQAQLLLYALDRTANSKQLSWDFTPKDKMPTLQELYQSLQGDKSVKHPEKIDRKLPKMTRAEALKEIEKILEMLKKLE